MMRKKMSKITNKIKFTGDNNIRSYFGLLLMMTMNRYQQQQQQQRR